MTDPIFVAGSFAVTWKLVVQIAITAWMVAISVMDHRTGRIPNVWTVPVMFGAGLYRLIYDGWMQGEYARFMLLAAWAGIFALWMLHFIGGGDAKFLMAEFALFPFIEFAAVLAFILLVLTLPLLLLEMRGRSISTTGRSLRDRLLTGQVLPTEQDLQERGRRYAWTFAIPGIVFTWVYW